MTLATQSPDTTRLETRSRVLLHAGTLTTMALPVALLVMIAFFAMRSPVFLTEDNLFVILRQSAVLGVAAAGATVILISGKLDISQGAVIAASGIACIWLLGHDVPAVLAIALGLLLGAALGLVNGLLTEVVRIPGFIATLATALVIRGAAQVLTEGQSVAAPARDGFDLLAWVGVESLGPFPISVLVLLAIYVLTWFLLRRTTWGLRSYAIGSSARASRVAGLPIQVHGISVFVFAGLMSGLAGVLLAGRLGSASASNGAGAEFDIFAAIVLGGASLFGGRGSVLRSLLGIVFLTTLTNGLVILNVSSYYQSIATGVVLLVALSLDRWRAADD